MPTPFVVLRGESIFTLTPWPRRAPNPGKFRWLVHRDGQAVGAARTKADAARRIREGFYDPAP